MRVLADKTNFISDDKNADIIIEDIKKLYMLLDKIQMCFIKFYNQEKLNFRVIFNNDTSIIPILKTLQRFWFNENIYHHKTKIYKLIKKKNNVLIKHVTNQNFIKYVSYFETYIELKNEIEFLIDEGNVNFDVYNTSLINLTKNINDIIVKISND